MGTQIKAKGSIGIPWKVLITQWKKSGWWSENPSNESYKNASTNKVSVLLKKNNNKLSFCYMCIYLCIQRIK